MDNRFPRYISRKYQGLMGRMNRTREHHVWVNYKKIDMLSFRTDIIVLIAHITDILKKNEISRTRTDALLHTTDS
jgi:hypothetical protein